MSPLATAMQAEGLAGTRDEIQAAFGATVIIRTDDTRWSYQGVSDRISKEVAGAILVLMSEAANDPQTAPEQRALLSAELISFQLGSKDGKTGGLDLSRPERQQQMADWIALLIALEKPAAAAAVSAVKALGVLYGPLWQKHSLPALPTVEEIDAAKAEILNQQQVAALQTHISGLVAGGASVVEIKASVAAWEPE